VPLEKTLRNQQLQSAYMATSEAPTTIGEMVAGTSRVSLMSTAIYLQVVSIGSCLAMALAFKSMDPQFFSRSK
jgi:hypothetical protein